MSRQLQRNVAFLLLGLTVLTGCQPTQPFFMHEDGDLSHYLDVATQIEHPDVEIESLPDAIETQAPLTLDDPEFGNFWDLTLQDCIHIALQNTKVFRLVPTSNNQIREDTLLSRPQARGQFSTPAGGSIFDNAIVESSTSGTIQFVDGNGNRTTGANSNPTQVSGGVESALAEFDAVFSSSLTANKTDQPSNSTLVANQSDTLDYQNAISKRTAYGSVVTFRHRIRYEDNNLPSGFGNIRPHPSDWFTSLEAGIQVPLMRGRGTMINRIPIMLARIDSDVSLAQFEVQARDFVRDVENAYWDLYCAYRRLEAAKLAQDAALELLRHPKPDQNAQQKAQIEGQYYRFRGQAQMALAGNNSNRSGFAIGSDPGVYDSERRLRHLLGLAATDGRLMRPIDEPVTARVDFDWNEILVESFARSPELRQQRWRVKSDELSLIAARNGLLPDLSLTAEARFVGRGDQLIRSTRNGQPFITNNGFPVNGSTAWEQLTGGAFQEMTLGLTFTPPALGMRREKAAVRHWQFQLARSKAYLEEMESDLSHVLTKEYRALKTQFELLKTSFKRWRTAQDELTSATASYDVGSLSIDILLQVQQRLAEAQRDYYTALCQYNFTISAIHARKGSLLEYDNIQLAEGPWPHKAYWDALERARERDASYMLDYGSTRPSVISRGTGNEFINDFVPQDGELLEELPTRATAPPLEEAPAPEAAPQPNDLPMPVPGTQTPTMSAPQPPVINAPDYRAENNGLNIRAKITGVAAAKPVVAKAATAESFDWKGFSNQSDSSPVQQASYTQSIYK